MRSPESRREDDSSTSSSDSDSYFVNEALSLYQSAYQQEMDEALSHIPNNMKAAYMEALQKCPRLVNAESDLQSFLRRDNFNPWAAALRLVMYWRTRKRLFGDNAFRSVTSSLDDNDLALLRSGALTLVPEKSGGNFIVRYDPSRLASLPPSGCTVEAHMRCWFVLAQKLAQSVTSQRSGCLFVVMLHDGDRESHAFLNSLNREPLEILLSAFPVKVKNLVIVRRTSYSPSMDDLVVSVLSYVGTALSAKAIVAFGDSTSDLEQALEKHGLPSHCIRPPSDPDMVTLAGIRKSEGPIVNPGAPLSGSVIASGPPQQPPWSTETRALQELSAAVNSMSLGDKDAYLEAVQRAPGLFETECPPLRFLRTESFDVVKAAHRMAKYWKLRKETYGITAFSPLSLVPGCSALSAADFALLNSGCVAILPTRVPRTEAESSAAVWILRDRLLLAENVNASTLRRIMFFLCSILSETASQVTFVDVLAMDSDHSEDLIQSIADYTRDAMPIRFTRFHNVLLAPKIGWRMYHKEIFPPVMNALSHVDFPSNLTSIHIGHSKSEVLVKLEVCGFSSEFIPSDIGGDCDIQEIFNTWKTNRYHIDSQRLRQLPHASSNLPSFRGQQQSSFATTLPIAQRKVASPMDSSLSYRAENQLFDAGHSSVATLPTDQDSRSALTQAIKVAPDLVQKESPQGRFLAFAQNDGLVASLRQATYWKIRLALFDKQALLPMQQTGEGALSREDTVALSAAFIVLLRNDNHGRPVLLLEPSRIQVDDLPTLKRLSFYMGHVMSETEPVAQSSGCVILLVVNSPTDMDERIGQCVNVIRQSLPLHIQCLRIIFTAEYSARTSPQSLSAQAYQFMQANSLHTLNVVTHTGSSNSKLLASLQQVGLAKESLPPSIGGTWSYERFNGWQDMRIRYEWQLPIRGAKEHGAAPVPKYTVEPLNQLSEASKTERKRRLHILHSRRSRGRKKIETSVLADQVSDLRARNEKVRRNNSRLEQILQEATDYIENLESSTPPP